MSDIDAGWQSLQENGYAVIRGAVDPELRERTQAAVSAFKQRNGGIVSANADESGFLYRVVNLHLAVPELTESFVANRALAVCDRYFGEPTALYTSLYYERGSEQDLHRDTPYFCTRPPGRYLGLWLALDDVDAGNGALMVVPGSHRLPPIDVVALRRSMFGDEQVPRSSQPAWDRYQAEVQAQCRDRGMTPVEVHVGAGDAIIWHPEMLHGGSPHRDRARARRSLVSHVTPKGVAVHHMDVFFHPEREVETRAGWGYTREGDRDVASFPAVDFGHQYSIPVTDLA